MTHSQLIGGFGTYMSEPQRVEVNLSICLTYIGGLFRASARRPRKIKAMK